MRVGTKCQGLLDTTAAILLSQLTDRKTCLESLDLDSDARRREPSARSQPPFVAPAGYSDNFAGTDGLEVVGVPAL